MCPIIEDVPLFKAQLEFDFCLMCLMWKWPKHRVLFVDGWLTFNGKRIREIDIMNVYNNTVAYYAMGREADTFSELIDIIKEETGIEPISNEEAERKIKRYTDADLL